MTSVERIDCLVIGAGVVGIACARALQLAGRSVILAEKHPHFGSEVSSRNSGVIHAGFYYPENSLKARLCVAGKKMLYAYARDRGINVLDCGKLVVAQSIEQTDKLRALQAQGAKNGVDDLEIWDADQIKRAEPNVVAQAALWSPSTGIIDVHDLMVNMLGDFENAGGTYVHSTEIIGGQAVAEGLMIETADLTLQAGLVINAAGLGAQTVAASITGMDKDLIPKQYLARGNYFWLEGKAPFERLIYPLPTVGGLGAHSLIDFNGRTRFGPDVEWIDTLDYTVNEGKKQTFIDLIKGYYPALDGARLHPDFAGIRPKIVGPDVGVTDFLIQTEKDHKIKGLVNLFGIESPGLTSSMALADYVACGIVENN